MRKNARLGRFYLDADFVENDEKVLPRIMAVCRIYRAEHFLYRNVIEYQAESEYFDIAEPEIEVPKYQWLDTVVNGDIRLSVERVG